MLYIVIKRIKCTELFYQKEPEPGIGVESIICIETDQCIEMGGQVIAIFIIARYSRRITKYLVLSSPSIPNVDQVPSTLCGSSYHPSLNPNNI